MIIHIRDAKVEDRFDIVNINIEMWKKTYNKIMNEEIFIEREKNREKIINVVGEKIENKEFFYKVAIVNGQIVGFINYGKSRDENINIENLGEIYAIYILEDFHKKNIGNNLIEYAKLDLKKEGFDSLIIWTLEENINREFYEKIGGKKSFNRDTEIMGQKLVEIGYLYKNI